MMLLADNAQQHALTSSRTLRLSWVLITILCITVPLFVVEYLPANDYPFHLARITILSTSDNEGLLGSFYQLGSWLLPNIAMDAVAVPLSSLLTPTLSVKLFIVLTQMAFLLGAFMLHRCGFNNRSLWPLLTSLLLFNGIFLYGFYNYLFSAALAIIAAALWLKCASVNTRRIGAFPLALILMWAHMGGFAVYAIMVGTFQLHQRLASPQRFHLQIIELAKDASPFIAAIAVFLLLSPVAERVSDPVTYSVWLGSKFHGLLFTLQGGVLSADIVTALSLGLLISTLAVTRRLDFNNRLLSAAGALWLAFALLPPNILGSQFADVRLGPIAAIVTLLSFSPKPSQQPWPETLVLLVAIGAGLFKTTTVVIDWRAHQGKIEQIVSALKILPEHSTLLSATAAPYTSMWLAKPGARETWHPPLKHVASYASVYGRVFVPMTFADPEKQPMVVSPPYQAVKTLQGDNPFKVPTAESLRALCKKLDSWLLDYQVDSPAGPSYLLVTGTSRYPLPALPGFEPFASGNDFLILKHRSNIDAHSQEGRL